MLRVNCTKRSAGLPVKARLLFGILLLALSLSVYAERSRREPGVVIPDAPAGYVPGFTRIDASERGARLITSLNDQQAWQVLNQTLSKLQIGTVQDRQPELITQWVLWIYDEKSDTARSKPRSIFSNKRERHRFRFIVSSDTTGQGSVIQVEDHSRQKEVDIAPDSEYSWLEWQDRPAQPAAARTFLQRLQGDFEAAMSSQLVSVSTSRPQTESAHIRPPTVPAAKEQIPPPAPASSAAVAIKHTEDIAPVPAASTVSTDVAAEVPVSGTVASPTTAVAVGSTTAVETKLAAPSLQSGVKPEEVPVARPASSQPATTTAAVTTSGSSSQTAAIPSMIQDGLLVDANPATAWQALLRALKDLGIAQESSDQRQYIVTTAWIDSFYDQKNQQFTVRSKDEERWAFNWRGQGLQRHRFQLILIPVDAGNRSMIYAYHTGNREQIDTTPDSSQTLLKWVDRETDPRVANAFLRRLRIVVIP